MTLPSCNPKLGYSVTQIMSTHYPERLGLAICVNHSPVFQVLSTHNYSPIKLINSFIIKGALKGTTCGHLRSAELKCETATTLQQLLK